MRRLIVICLLLFTSGAWAQEHSSSVALMPFVVRSQENPQMVRKLIEDVFVRQLKAEGVNVVDPQEVAAALKAGGAVETEAQARSVGSRVKADYALFGSFNQVGNVISLDAKLVDVSGNRKTADLVSEERGMENLASAVNAITKQMSVYLMSKAVIADVRVKGNERIEADAIKGVIKSKKGEVLRPEQVSEDIKAIYKMGFFSKVDAEVSDSGAGKVLTFVVQENPTIQELRITGDKNIKEKDILAAISTKPFTVLQMNVVNDDVQKIIKLYEQKGFYNVKVTPKIEFPKDPRKATVIFDIDENKKVKIKKISFRGNKSFSARKLRGVMQTKEKNILSLVTDRGILQKDILETDVDRLTVFYHDRGFMDARVGSPEVKLESDGFHIEVPIEEGQRYKVTDVKMAGDKLEDKPDLTKKLKVKPKEYFSREELRKDMETLSKTYMDEGYAFTEVSPDVKRNPEDQTTDVTYNVKKGDVVRIGTIFITGNTKTRDNVIRREMKLSEGDIFSSTKLEQSLQNLKKLDYFEDVEIVPSEGSQKDILNLHVKVKEKLTGTISIGGGYSSDEGLFTSGEITQRNLFGRGQYIALKAHVGIEDNSNNRYIFSFTEPWLFDRHIGVGVDAYTWEQEYVDWTKDATGFRLRSTYPVGNYSRLLAYYNLEYDDATDVQASARLSPNPLIRSLYESATKSAITVGIERDSTDHPFLPTKGSVSSLTSSFGGSYLGGSYDFIKTEVHEGVYIPLFWKLVGFLRGEAGWLTQPNGEVPIYERFFLGGINSLRGFSYGEVAPKIRTIELNPLTGKPILIPGTNVPYTVEYTIGGTSYVVMNAELLFPLVEKMGMRGVLFFDAGNAYDGGINFGSLRTDAGAGVRWNSPLGPLRIEWGYNLDPQPGEDKYQWQFSAGAFF